MDTLARRIGELRKERKLSLERFARLVDISTKSVSTWEKDLGDPELRSLIRIAQACNVSTDYLLGLTDHREPPPASGAGSDPRDPPTAREGSASKASSRRAKSGERKQRPRRAHRPPSA